MGLLINATVNQSAVCNRDRSPQGQLPARLLPHPSKSNLPPLEDGPFVFLLGKGRSPWAGFWLLRTPFLEQEVETGKEEDMR